MNIDIASIKPGGKVSVTLTDGTKIIDSPVTEGQSGVLFVNGLLVLRYYNAEAPDDLTVDAYTPPTPEWDRPEVYAVRDKRGSTWVRAEAPYWERLGVTSSNPAEAVERIVGPCTVLAVYAEGSRS